MVKRRSENRVSKLSVSVVVPVYNNENILPLTIPALIKSVSSQFARYELLFVNDGSTDGSLSLLQKAAAENRAIRVLSHTKNRGQQQSIATGMLGASENIAIGIDADLPCALNSLEKLARIAATGPELVLGRRTLYKPRIWWRRIGSWLGNSIFRILYPYEISDTGCSTAAVRRSLIEKFRHTNPKVLLIKPQLLALAANYVETEIEPPEVIYSAKSGYSAWRLIKLLWLMVLCRFKLSRNFNK